VVVNIFLTSATVVLNHLAEGRHIQAYDFVPGPGFAQFIEDNLFYDEEDARFSSRKTVETFFCQEFVTC